MFIVYLLLVLMGLVVANFVVTYTLYSAVDRDMREEIMRLKISISDNSANRIALYEELRSKIYDIETRCKSFIGKGKKRRTPEAKDEGKNN